MPTEFKLLTGPELTAVDPRNIPWPVDTFGIAAFEEGKLVGISTIINMPMIEGTMVVDEKQGGTLAYRLIQRIEQLYKTLNKTHAWAMVDDKQPEVANYLERVGFKKFPVQLYVKELTKAEEKVA